MVLQLSEFSARFNGIITISVLQKLLNSDFSSLTGPLSRHVYSHIVLAETIKDVNNAIIGSEKCECLQKPS